MKNINIILAILLGITNISTIFAADIKLAQTGFQFLSVTSDAGAGGMAEAVTTLPLNSSALFFNPAGMSTQNNLIDVRISDNPWIADIHHTSVSASYSPNNGRYGVFGFTLQNVDYGDIQGTMVWNNDQGYKDTEIIYPIATAIGVGYAKSLSDKFSVGLHIKKAYQYLGRNVIPATDTSNSVIKNTAEAIAFDFGTVYYTGWNDFSFGMSIRNFSQEIKYQTEGFQLPLTFTMGASVNLMSMIGFEAKQQSLILSIDALHPRSYSERINLGLEYTLFDLLVLRSGYLYNYDQRGLTAGIGIQKTISGMLLEIDYAYTPFGVFDNVQRFSLNIAI